MPDATTLPNGAIFSFNNNQSSGAITINNNSNTLVVSVPSGGFAEVVLLDNSIAAGSWDRHFKAPSNVSWSTNTLDYAGSITSATWNGNVVAINRGGTGSSTQNFVDLTTTQTIGGAKTFSGVNTFTSSLYSNNITFNNSGYTQVLQPATLSVNRTITLPNATGTLALTSDLSNYVPYTGATSSVDLGNFNFDANVISGASIIAKLNGSSSSPFILNTGSSGYTFGNNAISFISSPNATNTLIITSNISSTTKIAQIGLGSLTATRTYTLPDATGTLALTSNLSSYVPYTGATADVNLGTNSITALVGSFANGNLTGNGSNPANLYLKKGVAPFFTNVTGYGLIAAISSSFIFVSDVDGTNYKYASFNLGSLTNNTNRAYTLPDASGTLALTSNLSSYVPYSGATGAVDLGSNDLTANYINGKQLTVKKNGTTAGVLFLETGSGSGFGGANGAIITSDTTNYLKFQIVDSSGINFKTGIFNFGSLTTNTNRTYTLPDASGTIALVGGSGVGTVTSVAALTLGTTGTDLSSSVANSTTTPVITLNVPTASATNRGVLSSADWTTFNNKQNALTNPVTGTGTSGQVTYFNGTSTVTSSANYFWDATNNRLGIGTSSPIKTLDVNGEAYIRGWATFNSTDVNGWYSTIQSSGTAFAYLGSTAQFAATGGTATDFGIRSQNAIAFYTNGGNERMRISSAGDVGIGGSPSGSYKLEVTGTAKVSGALTAASGAFGSTSISSTTIQNSGNFYIGTSAANFLQFYTNNNNAMIITSAGNVGIGTSSPAYTLSVTGTSGAYFSYNASSTYFRIRPSAANGTVNLQYGADGGAAPDLIFSSDSNAERMRITSGGCVGIGGANSYGKLDVGGQTNSSTNQEVCRLGNISGLNNGLIISVNTSNNYVYSFGTLGTGTVSATSGVLSASSDKNLKNDDGGIENALDKVLQLNPRYFHWKEESGLPTDIRQLGFYAQEVNEALGEEAANTPKTEDDKWGIYDRALIAMLTKAIQEQNQTIQELKERLDKAGL